jgi:hypothetical protein
MIRKLAAAIVAVAVVSLGSAPVAEAARPQPDPTSLAAVSFYYRCGDYQHGPVRGWLVRTRWGYLHTNSEPFTFAAECIR